MRMELQCPHCFYHFTTAPETRLGAILERLLEEGPWSALGDGETVEDSLFAALTGDGASACPACGRPVAVSEESLGQFTLELLHQW